MTVYSASQLEVLQCPRRWVGQYLHKWPRSAAPSARLGTRSHEVAEAWLRDALPPDPGEILTLPYGRGSGTKDHRPGQIIANGLHLLPPPRTVVCEGNITLTTPQGVEWRGTIDFWGAWDRGSHYYVPDGQGPIQWLLLGDHKTTSGPQYAKDSADLIRDTQACLYALHLMDRFGHRLIDLRWVYYLTSLDKAPSKPGPDDPPGWLAKWEAWVEAGRPLAWAVTATLTRAEAVATVSRAEAQALMADRIRDTNPDPDQVPPNRAECDKFGGCPHRGVRCVLTMDDLLTEGDDMDAKLASFLASRGVDTGGAGAPPPPPPIPPQAGRIWTPGDPMNEAQAYLQGQNKPLFIIAMAADNPPTDLVAMAWPGAREPYNPAPPVTTIVNPPPAPVESGRINPPEAPAVAATTPQHAAQLQGITPPAPPAPTVQATDMERDALKREAMALGLVDGSSRLGAKSLRDMIQAFKAEGGLSGSVEPAPPPPPAPILTQIVNPPPAPDPDGQDSWQNLPPAPPAPIWHRDPLPGASGTMPGIRTLYVNCTPIGTGAPVPFALIAAMATVEFRAAHPGIPHYGLIDYGRGPALWVEFVAKALAQIGGRDVVVDTRSREGADALSLLERSAGSIVRGF